MNLSNAIMTYMFIYLAAIFAVVSLVCLLVKSSRASSALWAASIVLVVGIGCRAFIESALPLRSMFDIFLVLATLYYPAGALCNRLTGQKTVLADAILQLVLLCPLIFAFNPQQQPLAPILRSDLFAPHVLSYMLAYVLLFKAAVIAVRVLRNRAPILAVDKPVMLAMPFMTAGLLLGAVWGKLAWGDWWNWDPKELWSLACWCVYFAYLHLRIAKPTSRRTAATIALIGFVCVVLTLVWVNLSHSFSGMHNYAG